MSERTNGRDVIDRLVKRQIKQREKEGRQTSSADLRDMKARARESRLRGERRRDK